MTCVKPGLNQDWPRTETQGLNRNWATIKPRNIWPIVPESTFKPDFLLLLLIQQSVWAILKEDKKDMHTKTFKYLLYFPLFYSFSHKCCHVLTFLFKFGWFCHTLKFALFFCCHFSQFDNFLLSYRFATFSPFVKSCAYIFQFFLCMALKPLCISEIPPRYLRLFLWPESASVFRLVFRERAVGNSRPEGSAASSLKNKNTHWS